MVKRTLLLLLILLPLFISSAGAQEVRDERAVGSVGKAFRKAAEEQNKADWPIKSLGVAGSAVRLTFDAQNADINIVTDKSYGQEHLLQTLKQLAVDLDLPQSDFIRYPDTDSATNVDLEMNDHLTSPAPRVTAFDFDLSRFAALLEKSDLPKPIWLGIRADHSQLNTVFLQTPQGKQRLSGIVFLNAREIAPGSRLLWRAEVHWSGYLIGFLMLFTIGFALTAPFRLAKQKQQAQNAPLPTPDEVQKHYDKSPPFSLVLVALPLLMALLMATGNLTRAMESMLFLIPAKAVSTLPFVMLGAMALSLGGVWLRKRLRGTNAGVEDTLPDPDDPTTWTKTAFLLPMIPMMFVMGLMFALMPYWNPFQSLPPELRRNASTWLPIAFVVIGFLPSVILSYLASKKTRKTLQPGEEWYERTMQLAEKAGVKVKQVVEVWNAAPNAYASVFGTVGLNRGLLTKLEPLEIESVIAHELGHHKDGHPRRNFWFSLVTTAAMLGVWWALQSYLESHFTLTTEFKALLRSPLFVIFLLPVLRSLLIGKGQRAREEAADRFAVDTMGDPELVIRALTKIHDLDLSPHRLKPVDEALHSHPSLEHRIAAIREYAREKRTF